MITNSITIKEFLKPLISSTMETKKILLILSSFFFFSLSSEALITTNTTDNLHDFLSCLAKAEVLNVTTMSSVHPSSYYNLLNSSIRNLRFTGPTVSKPVAIVLPSTKHQLGYSVHCSRISSLAIRVRSGGHSYEGLSYTDEEQSDQFVIIDLMNLNRVWVNLTSSTAWVESGATLGEIYYSVATESGGSLGFPAGSCSTIGSGGHIGGGGFGFLSRKFGLAADNVLDAVLIDPNGRVLDRAAMGEDIFWAIRGGGGGSWGAVYAWNIRLVPVPNRVTVFSVQQLGPSQLLAQLVHKWQNVGPKLSDEFYLSTTISAENKTTISVSFSGQFLGPSSDVISVLTQQFPELGLTESDCKEMSWIDSVVYFAGLTSIADLTVHESSKSYFKAKSDYVQSPISVTGLTDAFDFLAKEPVEAYIILDPYGGAMDRFKSYDIPFPHRRGNLYSIQYMVDWTTKEDAKRERYITFLRRFYEYMAPFVSRNPRAAYVNYLDLDLGVYGGTKGGGGARDAVGEARVWGEKYFLKNYDRLVKAKTIIDPENVFSNAQSIPPLPKH